MPSPSGSQRARRVHRGHGVARPFSLGAAVLAVATAHCTFPDYDADGIPGAAAGSGATGAKGGSGGSGATSNTAAAAPTEGGAGAGNISGGGASGAPYTGDPECWGQQWPADYCELSCLRLYPDHCFDGAKADGEVDVDCGADCQACSKTGCDEARDCLSGRCDTDESGSHCHAPLTVSMTAHEQNNSVGSTSWTLNLKNVEPVGGDSFPFTDLVVRYYFDRLGVVEPVLVRATQANLQQEAGGSRGLSLSSWSVERVEDIEDAAFNAYVEVKFADTGELFPGDQIQIYQQLITGNPANSNFDQRANYSFSKDGGETQHVTVYYKGKLVWGLAPKPVNPRACFFKGVNLNGQGLMVAGNAWLGWVEAGVTTDGTGVSQGQTPYPPVTGGLSTMLGSQTRLDAGHSLSVPADNGTYLAYVYATSPVSESTINVFMVQGIEFPNSSKWRSQGVDGGWAWAKLGPYRVDIDDGKLTLAVTSGSINFAGVELFYPE